MLNGCIQPLALVSRSQKSLRISAIDQVKLRHALKLSYTSTIYKKSLCFHITLYKKRNQVFNLRVHPYYQLYTALQLFFIVYRVKTWMQFL